MRKCLLLVALLLVSQVHNLYAQFLFEAPDTVCIKQPITLKSNVPNAASHYWGFCSGYLFDAPNGYKLADPSFELDGPTAIEIAKDGDNYYGFVANSKSNSFVRLAFGNSLSNTPVATNFGSMGGALPESIYTMYVVKDEAKGNWHIFLGGGTEAGNSALARIDFGQSFDSTPNIVNFGNLQGLAAGPRGMFIAKEDDKWFGFFVNYQDWHLIKMEIDTNISLTPALVDIGAFLDGSGSSIIINPTDMAVLNDNGRWKFYITNERNSWLTFLTLTKSLAETQKVIDIQASLVRNPNDVLDAPSSISAIKDCDSIHLFITNRAGNELIRIDLDKSDGINTDPVNYLNVGTTVAPISLSRIIRDRDNIYMFIANSGDNSISRIAFEQCNDASITYSLTWRPPTYHYDTPGYYNVYYAINEGMPDMQYGCRQIAALPIPSMIVSNDTIICQGDSVHLTAYSVNALSTTWSPNHNLSKTSGSQVTARPDYTQTYHIVLPFKDGCIVDTPINITVHKIKADAGPDRTLQDGAETLLGGPLTSLGPQYSYVWHPSQYLDNKFALNPVAKPPYDFTYYLQITDTAGCVRLDTVNIYVRCEGFNMPNIFVPGARNGVNARFGIANSNIVKLSYFRIYDRWGKEVFSTTDPLKQWDGTVNGEAALMGVYVWEADGFCASGQRVSSKGNVTLVR